MTTTPNADSPVTFINVFAVEPARQQELLDLLDQATQVVRRAPGFISARLHRSVDGAKVAMYAQWQSAGHYQAMRGNPEAAPFLERALAFATFEPGMYEVVEDYSPQ